MYQNVPALTYFPYPPGSLLLIAPTVYFFKDPRVLFIITETLTALILYKLLAKTSSKISELIPIIYLYFPISYFILEQSWLDPLASFFLALIAYINFVSDKNRMLKTISLGILLIIKQYLLIIPVFFLKTGSKNIKNLIFGLLVAVAILFSFYIINPGKFNVYRTEYSYRYDSLTFISYLNNNFELKTPKQFVLTA